MNEEFIRQYNHTWRVLEGIVRDFDEAAWKDMECGYMMPARLAYHILHSTQYYIEDSSEVICPSGKLFEGEWLAMDKAQLPTRDDSLSLVNDFRSKTTQWLEAMDLGSSNPTFPWAGETKAGVVIFLLRHMLYHLGELNALLYQSKDGKAADNFIKAFN